VQRRARLKGEPRVISRFRQLGVGLHPTAASTKLIEPVDLATRHSTRIVRARQRRKELQQYPQLPTYPEEAMKYLCLGYFEESKWDSMSKEEQEAMIEECFAYDDGLRKNGHFVRGEALQSSRSAVTLRWRNGKVSFTDGPYAETKEQIGGLCLLEATDMNHALQLMSKHPVLRLGGPFEIRPIDEEFTARVEARGR
jgi:hypothetical protein